MIRNDISCPNCLNKTVSLVFFSNYIRNITFSPKCKIPLFAQFYSSLFSYTFFISYSFVQYTQHTTCWNQLLFNVYLLFHSISDILVRYICVQIFPNNHKLAFTVASPGLHTRVLWSLLVGQGGYTHVCSLPIFAIYVIEVIEHDWRSFVCAVTTCIFFKIQTAITFFKVFSTRRLF